MWFKILAAVSFVKHLGIHNRSLNTLFTVDFKNIKQRMTFMLEYSLCFLCGFFKRRSFSQEWPPIHLFSPKDLRASKGNIDSKNFNIYLKIPLKYRKCTLIPAGVIAINAFLACLWNIFAFPLLQVTLMSLAFDKPDTCVTLCMAACACPQAWKMSQCPTGQTGLCAVHRDLRQTMRPLIQQRTLTSSTNAPISCQYMTNKTQWISMLLASCHTL